MKTVLVGAFLDEKYVATFSSLGYNVIKLPPCSTLPKPVCDHPDMIMFYDRNKHELIMSKQYFCENEAFFRQLEEKTGVKVISEDVVLSDKYPFDILYDALSVNHVLYGKKDCVSSELLSRHKKFVPVKQGYTRCSVALLSEECAVTSDKELALKLREQGLNVLEICQGHIELKGYDYGFIGGAGGPLNEDTYCFFGDIELHPDGEKIIDFAKENKIKTVSLSELPLSDNGGFICF